MIEGGQLRGPSLDLHGPVALRRREPTLPGGSRHSLDEIVRAPGARAETKGEQPPTTMTKPYLVGRLGQRTASQPFALAPQKTSQDSALGATHYTYKSQSAPNAMWGTPEANYIRGGSGYNNPLAEQQATPAAGQTSIFDEADSFFLPAGDTFVSPVQYLQ